MNLDRRRHRILSDWLVPSLVVAAAMVLGLALFASETSWWPPMAGPATGVIGAPTVAAVGSR